LQSFPTIGLGSFHPPNLKEIEQFVMLFKNSSDVASSTFESNSLRFLGCFIPACAWRSNGKHLVGLKYISSVVDIPSKSCRDALAQFGWFVTTNVLVKIEKKYQPKYTNFVLDKCKTRVCGFWMDQYNPYRFLDTPTATKGSQLLSIQSFGMVMTSSDIPAKAMQVTVCPQGREGFIPAVSSDVFLQYARNINPRCLPLANLSFLAPLYERIGDGVVEEFWWYSLFVRPAVWLPNPPSRETNDWRKFFLDLPSYDRYPFKSPCRREEDEARGSAWSHRNTWPIVIGDAPVNSDQGLIQAL